MENFPHQSLTAISGKPTAHALMRMKRKLTANAMSVPSNRGGGTRGHLILLMIEPDYLLVSGGNVFDEPTHPGNAPTHANNASTAAIHAADTAYNRELAEYKIFIATRNALKQQILSTIEEPYYDVLMDPTFGYANVTPLQLLTHLESTYGTKTPKDLERNRDNLRSPWNPDDDIATLWT